MDFTKAHIAVPLVNTEKVIWAKQNTLTVPQYSGSPVVTQVNVPLDGIVSGNTYGGLPFGIYSYDNGSTWNGFTTTLRDVTALSAQTTLSYLYSTDSARFATRIDAAVGAGSTIPILVKYGFIQLPGTAASGETVSIDTTKSLYNQKTAFDSRYPVPRLAIPTMVVTGTGLDIVIPHGQTSEPDVRIGAYAASVGVTTGLTGSDSIELGDMRIDATNITIVGSSTSFVYFVNIYLPEVS